MTTQDAYERQLLGLLIQDSDTYYQNSDIVTPDLFVIYSDIFEAYMGVIGEGRKPGFTKMISVIPDRRTDITSMVRGTEYTVPLEDIVAELEENRKVRFIDEHLAKATTARGSEDKAKALTDAITGLYRTSKAQFVDGFTAAKEALKAMETKREIEIPTGFPYLDSLTSGLQRSDLVILAAETSQGKTSMAMSIAQNVINSGRGVAVISLEMTQGQIMQRMMAAESGVPTMKAMENLEQVQRCASGFANLKFYIACGANNSATHILGLIRSSVIRYNVDVVVVDYLQLVSDKSQKSQEQEIGQIARSLKNIAKELNINIIALSQLSRAGRGQSNYPTLSRLRDSGQVEEAADLVLFIYRAEVYGILQDDMGESTEGKAEIIIAKGRSYGTGKFTTSFEKEITRFGLPVYRDGHGGPEEFTASKN